MVIIHNANLRNFFQYTTTYIVDFQIFIIDKILSTLNHFFRQNKVCAVKYLSILILKVQFWNRINRFFFLTIDNVRINLSGGNGFMSEQFTHRVNVYSIRQQQDRVGMSATMKGDVLGDSCTHYPTKQYNIQIGAVFYPNKHFCIVGSPFGQ